jgi:hypothetical protein
MGAFHAHTALRNSALGKKSTFCTTNTENEDIPQNLMFALMITGIDLWLSPLKQMRVSNPLFVPKILSKLQ